MSAFRISKTFRGIRPVDKDGRDGLSNPERGFRFEIGVGRLPSDPVQFRYLRDLWPFPRYRRDGVTVSQAYCYLSQFHSSAVSDEKIAAALEGKTVVKEIVVPGKIVNIVVR